MGFYVRTGVKAGPFRFTLSKSGIGVSAGIPGFRAGVGPRGNYVRVGGRGVHYRTTGQRLMPQASPMPPAAAHRPSRDTIAAVVLGAALMPYGLILWLVAAPFCWWLFLRDKARRTVVAFYEVNDAPAAWFDALVADWSSLVDSQRRWRVVQEGQIRTTYQHKTNAGATSVVRRIACAANLRGPRHLSTNVAVPSLVAGRSSLHFLPDRVLVRDHKRYSDVAYGELTVYGACERFMEDPGRCPSDAQQVGQTWQFVNVKGGPDRRYSRNRVLPIMLYGALDMTSRHGLSWRVQVSRGEAAVTVARRLRAAPQN